MKIISITALKEFWEEFPKAEQPLKAWFDEAKKPTGKLRLILRLSIEMRAY